MPWPQENKHAASLAFVYRTQGSRLQRQWGGGALPGFPRPERGGLSVCLPGSLLPRWYSQPHWPEPPQDRGRGTLTEMGGELCEDSPPPPSPRGHACALPSHGPRSQPCLRSSQVGVCMCRCVCRCAHLGAIIVAAGKTDDILGVPAPRLQHLGCISSFDSGRSLLLLSMVDT